jgi:20S proteasome subunit alpha 3
VFQLFWVWIYDLMIDDGVVEFAVLTLDEVTKQPKAKIYKPAEINALLLAEGLMKKDEDTEMKAA